jgi:IS30 family transposase
MGRIGGRPWTTQDDDLLQKLAADGMSAPAIAAEMSRSDTTIRRRAKEIEVEIRKAQMAATNVKQKPDA